MSKDEKYTIIIVFLVMLGAIVSIAAYANKSSHADTTSVKADEKLVYDTLGSEPSQIYGLKSSNEKQACETWESELLQIHGLKPSNSFLYKLTDPTGNEYFVLDNGKVMILLSKKENK